MPDLRFGVSVSDELWLEEYDLWKSGDMETALSSHLKLQQKQRVSRRKRKIDKTPKWFRQGAFIEAKALDGLSRNRLIAGLEHFCGGAGVGPGLAPPPTLVLHMDEASSNVSLLCWLQYKAGLWVMVYSGPSHRCWNDGKLSILLSSQYWVVLMCRLVYNFTHGYWGGHSCFEKLKTAGEEAIKLLPVKGRGRSGGNCFL